MLPAIPATPFKWTHIELTSSALPRVDRLVLFHGRLHHLIVAAQCHPHSRSWSCTHPSLRFPAAALSAVLSLESLASTDEHPLAAARPFASSASHDHNAPPQPRPSQARPQPRPLSSTSEALHSLHGPHSLRRTSLTSLLASSLFSAHTFIPLALIISTPSPLFLFVDPASPLLAPSPSFPLRSSRPPSPTSPCPASRLWGSRW